MVKKGSTIGPRPPVNSDGTPRKSPGPQPKAASELRGERLVLRVHPDFQDLLTMLARERGISRSAYIERVLLGWVSADPRNPRLDAIGKKIPGVPSPHELLKSNPVRFGQRWKNFSDVSSLLLGETPPQTWLEDFEDQAIPDVPAIPPVGDGDDE